MSRVFRTTTMEEFDALIGDNDDLLLELAEGLPPDVSLVDCCDRRHEPQAHSSSTPALGQGRRLWSGQSEHSAV